MYGYLIQKKGWQHEVYVKEGDDTPIIATPDRDSAAAFLQRICEKRCIDYHLFWGGNLVSLFVGIKEIPWMLGNWDCPTFITLQDGEGFQADTLAKLGMHAGCETFRTDNVHHLGAHLGRLMFSIGKSRRAMEIIGLLDKFAAHGRAESKKRQKAAAKMASKFEEANRTLVSALEKMASSAAHKSWEGKWEFVRWLNNGMLYPYADTYKVEVKDGCFDFVKNHTRTSYALQIDPAKSTFTWSMSGKITHYGLYRFHGEELELVCCEQAAPQDFEGKPQYRFLLKHTKSELDEWRSKVGADKL